MKFKHKKRVLKGYYTLKKTKFKKIKNKMNAIALTCNKNAVGFEKNIILKINK